MEKSQEALILLRQVIRSTDMQEKEISRLTGLTLPQLMTMQALRQVSPVTTGELAKEVSLTQATVTSILDRLEKKELVTRERGVEDKRKVWIALSSNGLELMKGAPTTQQDMFTRRFDDMQDWEQSMIISALERVSFMLDAQHLDAAPMLDIGQIDRPSVEIDN
ncbi:MULTISPECIES: MarR family transcriptional regulator [unclassified Neptuniibacter]|uniref:MarR family winged helix-turn-helix transcriptional regulator n=1 Tax=unclassified Neptuniibacter TaxID=2630693 RepID=UPI000C6A30DD|nr:MULTISPECIES: MarR family transcriptional regulator [unclassified Neptuniibacter]MAY41541.1 MarR family transcriptional regulator [Oceanospirillaceae bacterium]|tara:strand:+ start:8398 stop:8889 length:492 start_codon:yes stop_codon:yes gene_type:complete